jgi:hypothetical protein
VSGPLAIAAASAVLCEVLQAGMTAMQLANALGGDVMVSVGAPDRVVRDGQGAITQLNIFLYNVLRNSGWANLDLPSRDTRGERISNPVLGLDLCYLLTAYGIADYDAEILLGGAMQVLHETPGLGREAIREALTPGPLRPNLPPQLQDAGLADQFEYLKITPLPMPSEEISRLWSAFQTPYRPSVAYMLSVVLIEPERSTRHALPVRERGVYVLPLRELRVDRIVSVAGPNAAITASSTLRILGRQLGARDIQVLVNGLDLSAGVVSRANDEIRVNLLLPQPLPAPPALPPGLRAGMCGVQLVQPVQMGDPLAPHEGFASNIVTFVLAPEIAPVVAVNAIDVTCTPPVGANQRVRLLLNQSDAPIGTRPRAYSFAAPARNGIVPPATETSVVSIPIANVVAGRYLVRLQVDGAQSALTIDATGRFDQPEVVL